MARARGGWHGVRQPALKGSGINLTIVKHACTEIYRQTTHTRCEGLLCHDVFHERGPVVATGYVKV